MEVKMFHKRYQFKDESHKFLAADTPAHDINTTIETRQRSSAAQLSRNPSNSMTTLASALVYKVDPNIDIRYQLVKNFGPYLIDIPRRLGINPALDAASDALVFAHTSFCSTFLPRSEYKLLTKYSYALKVLRNTLNDPVQAQSSETLCAIMVLMIVQVLANPAESATASHSQGAALILKGRGFFGPRDDFEKTLLATLKGPMIKVFEAVLCDNIRFTQREWKSFLGDGLEAKNINTDWFRCLSYLPDLMHRCRHAMHCSSTISGSSLPELVSEIMTLLDECRINIVALRDRLRTFEDAVPPSEITSTVHAQQVALLSLALFTGIVLSCVLSSLLEEPLRLRSEISQWSQEIVELAEVAVRYFPLGCMAIIICLYAAWIGARSDDHREKIETWIRRYANAWPGARPAGGLKANLEQTERRFMLEDPRLEYNYSN
ncbi:MAG: hypothetical protein M1812_001095 [Candelaria pacifica]|nr:MAG: hypothetical protein M1812_001095 [Candelaria pacifica]